MTVDEVPELDCETDQEIICVRDFHLRTSKKNWYDARAACAAEGMQLASIQSAEE